MLFDKLARYVVDNVAMLGSKIGLLADELRTHNKIENDKKRFNTLKSQVLSVISKQMKEEIPDAVEPDEQDAEGSQGAA